MNANGIPQDEIAMFQYEVWLDDFIERFIELDPDEVEVLPSGDVLDELYVHYPLQGRLAAEDWMVDHDAWE